MTAEVTREEMIAWAQGKLRKTEGFAQGGYATAYEHELACLRAAIAAIEASGTYIEMREYEALARAARAYLKHPDLASAAGTLQGMVQRAERALAARPRDVATPEQEPGR